ncbi:vesicle transport through interaction with t-SNAREs homolog 1B-like [Gorilla gorilla gorilla]|uniref:vesicle transport through interaction with t-SNAREs homolog 1B-like n=1 Tax=Gorilla gorilla gorilla TaxID=9595 RepID=UPI00300B810A
MATSAPSSEHVGKQHEIFHCLYEGVQGVPKRLLGAVGTKEKLIRDFDEKQQEVNKKLAEMEEELHYAPLSFRNPMMSKLQNYQKGRGTLPNYQEMRSTPWRATTGGRGDMKYSTHTCAAENEHMDWLQSQRAMLLQGIGSLIQVTQSTEHSHQTGTETDQIGSEITEEPEEQDRPIRKHQESGQHSKVGSACKPDQILASAVQTSRPEMTLPQVST